MKVQELLIKSPPVRREFYVEDAEGSLDAVHADGIPQPGSRLMVSEVTATRSEFGNRWHIIVKYIEEPAAK